MVGTSKILTVSYGTFSCTLEGFDDPFTTMKVIAEYFRDLAANDRYFGAEPPQPDMTQLAAIAQRTTSAPVGAAVDETGVHLTQTPDIVDETVEEADIGIVVPEDEPEVAVTAPEVLRDPDEAEADQTPDEIEMPPDTAPEYPDAIEEVGADFDESPLESVELEVVESIPETYAPGLEDHVATAVEIETEAPESQPTTANEDQDSLVESIEESIEELHVTDVEESRTNVIEIATAEVPVPGDLPLSERRADGEARAEARRRGLALSLTDDELAEAATHSVAPKSRPEVFDLRYETSENSSLSDEDEADLLAELAAAEADEAPVETHISSQVEPVDLLAEDEDLAAHEDADRPGRALLESDLIEREEAAIDRLLAKTNTKLSESSSQQNREQFSHLKAAVAATMAERSESRDSDQDDGSGDSAYREDLAKVVKPASDPEKTQKPAPLVLVADKADTPDSDEPKPRIRHAGGGVNPRRIRRDGTTETAREARARFADYTDKVGAYELTDLLEAAGAFLNTVEGKPDFTRPQIMHMVLHQDLEKKFTREDSLRGFENLLRKGAIQKVDRGKFAIGAESRFVS